MTKQELEHQLKVMELAFESVLMVYVVDDGDWDRQAKMLRYKQFHMNEAERKLARKETLNRIS